MSKAFYVSSTIGNDQSSSNGTDQKSPFASLQKAADIAGAGDTIYVMPGNYANPDSTQNVLTITRSGTAGAPITVKAFDPNNKPVVRVKNYVGIEILGSYINIDGLIVEGNAKEYQGMTADQVDALQKSQGRFTSPATSGTGIEIGNFYRNIYPHHVTISNSIVRDNPGGGISTIRADYVTVENNEVYRNAFYSPYDNSGISFYQSSNSDGNTGIKMIVRGNMVYGNQNLIKDYNIFKEENINSPDPNQRPRILDGNGIIIDDAARTQVQNVDGGQSAQNLPTYQGKTLIENNTVFDNGGRGIEAFNSANVDIRNNTLSNNVLTPGLLGTDVTVTTTDTAKAKGAGQGITVENNSILPSSASLRQLATTPAKTTPTLVAPEAIAISAPTTAIANSTVLPVPSEKYTLVGDSSNDILTGSNATGFNDLFGNEGDDVLNTGTASRYNYLIGGEGNDRLNFGSTPALMDIAVYDAGDGQDIITNFVHGNDEMNDQIHFRGIANVDVVVNGNNTELRVGDGIIGNAGFGTGALLVELKETTGLRATDLNISLFGSNFDF
jgi:parallel beta-helix repeat protein